MEGANLESLDKLFVINEIGRETNGVHHIY